MTSIEYPRRHESGMWEDEFGALGPAKPGRGPRTHRPDDGPTGPEIGARFPDVAAPSHAGDTVDVHEHRAGRAAVFVFYRSAVW